MSYKSMSNPKMVVFQPTPQHITQVAAFNKGTAFSVEERSKLRLRGLLPPKVETIEQQVPRVLRQMRAFETPMEKYIFLSALLNLNHTLFYRVITSNLKETMPIIYTPTVGEACQNFGLNFRTAQGMYFSPQDKGSFREMLDNWPLEDVNIIVVTDGSRILGLGDLGANGMGIPIGKLSLYVAGAGFAPRNTLPVTLDFGTDNEEYLEREEYLGNRHKRLTGDAYFELVDEFVAAVFDKWPHVLLQFEDFSTTNAFDLLERYRHKHLCFNDDIQGTGAVVLGGYINCLRALNLHPRDNRLVFFGAGSAGVGVADLIVEYFVEQGLSELEARRRFWFVDSRGLVTTNRGDTLLDHKVPYARDDIPDDGQLSDLKDIVAFVKPTSLIGLSGIGRTFTKEVIEEMVKHVDRPIIMALSNPTANAECTAEQAYQWTDGKAIFASGSPFEPVEYNGKVHVPGQGNNMFIFPGLGFGAYIGQCKVVSDKMIIAAAKALAEYVSAEAIANGDIYPDINDIRDISAVIATEVLYTAEKQGLLQNKVVPLSSREDTMKFVKSEMWYPSYPEASL